MNKILEIKNLVKSFGPVEIHRGLSIHLNDGEILGILGNSGTGKSVLLRSIIGLETINEGEIYFKGERIDLFDEDELSFYRTKISYSFQSGALFDSLNVFENLAYPLREHTQLNEQSISQKVYEALSMVKLENATDKMPSDLSGGMQKRVGLARSMILHPDIILYDEPTAGLDPANVENVVEIMRLFKSNNISGIFVTHDIPAMLKICDRIIILDNGKIAFEGTPHDFSTSTDDLVKKFSL